MIADAYLRRAAYIRSLDGDTFEFRIDLGYSVETRQDIRLRGFNAKELSEVEGHAMKEFADLLLRTARVIYVQSFKNRNDNDLRSFTRYVADVYVDQMSLADALSVQLLTFRRTTK